MAPLFLFLLLLPLYLQVHSQDLSGFSSEQTILLSFKQHWGSPPSLDSWNSTSSPCDWPEIECISGTVTALHLSGKDLSGTIPSTICQLKNLVSINLFDNNISGDVPAALYNCSSLERLRLSVNGLSGTIPGELFLMKKLRELHLDGNRLYGKIPTPIRASSLESLDLSDNQLNGSIPDDIGNLDNLMHLDLSNNSFSGTIPMRVFHMHQLYSMLLGYNNLSGELPTQLDFFSLQELNITHNQLHGTIPRSLGQLPQLSVLDLSDNHLAGDIIENILHLRSMSVLRLCSNNFSGKIPHEYVNHEFAENCFEFSNLCSDDRTEGLPSCPSNLCSDNRIQGFLKCHSKHDESKKHLIIIILEAVGCGVVGFAILLYLARKCWSKKQMIAARCKKIWPSGPPPKDKEEWRMISFQRLNFDKADILSSLTDENLIGNGGSGKVYRVLINQTGNAVAVKSISNARKSDRRLEKEFLAEIQTLGNIRHYNIVKLFCYISGKDLKLLVYQYLVNKSLDQWLHGNKREASSTGNSSVPTLDWPTRLDIAIGVAQGLSYMHHDCSPPIIHRDIKSSNILLDSEFNAKIADFGLAKLLSRHGDTITASAVAGTFGYIAPEYAYTRKVNTKGDVYSFGVVLLELTTRRQAVTQGDHMNLAGWAQLQYSAKNAIVDALDAEIKESIHLDQIITVFRLGVICTATSPSNRPSMKDCLHILQNCRNNFSSSSPMPLQLSGYQSLI
ncbi:receptor-like protein kinase 5 [Sesamum indicum]|uniref:Receptor-like protein kinase 5 n=1 Tax=Sesamum indicum TaxID=4182 RepID=A0A6I9TLA1_SESIN|nr:receptor-like protein kinase 5 [Sesamum indicum]